VRQKGRTHVPPHNEDGIAQCQPALRRLIGLRKRIDELESDQLRGGPTTWMTSGNCLPRRPKSAVKKKKTIPGRKVMYGSVGAREDREVRVLDLRSVPFWGVHPDVRAILRRPVDNLMMPYDLS
jgi:hypothetical protein